MDALRFRPSSSTSNTRSSPQRKCPLPRLRPLRQMFSEFRIDDASSTAKKKEPFADFKLKPMSRHDLDSSGDDGTSTKKKEPPKKSFADFKLKPLTLKDLDFQDDSPLQKPTKARELKRTTRASFAKNTRLSSNKGDIHSVRNNQAFKRKKKAPTPNPVLATALIHAAKPLQQVENHKVRKNLFSGEKSASKLPTLKLKAPLAQPKVDVKESPAPMPLNDTLDETRDVLMKLKTPKVSQGTSISAIDQGNLQSCVRTLNDRLDNLQKNFLEETALLKERLQNLQKNFLEETALLKEQLQILSNLADEDAQSSDNKENVCQAATGTLKKSVSFKSSQSFCEYSTLKKTYQSVIATPKYNARVVVPDKSSAKKRGMSKKLEQQMSFLYDTPHKNADK